MKFGCLVPGLIALQSVNHTVWNAPSIHCVHDLKRILEYRRGSMGRGTLDNIIPVNLRAAQDENYVQNPADCAVVRILSAVQARLQHLIGRIEDTDVDALE